MAEANPTDRPVPARYMLYEQVPMASCRVLFVLAGASLAELPRLLQAARTNLERESSRLAIESTTTMAHARDAGAAVARRAAAVECAGRLRIPQVDSGQD